MWISRTLLLGLLVSIAVMGCGLLLVIINGEYSKSHVLGLDEIVPALRRGDAGGILDLGILLLFATPLLGVVAATVHFARQRDVQFVVLTTLLLLVLVIGFIIGLR